MTLYNPSNCKLYLRLPAKGFIDGSKDATSFSVLIKPTKDGFFEFKRSSIINRFFGGWKIKYCKECMDSNCTTGDLCVSGKRNGVKKTTRTYPDEDNQIIDIRSTTDETAPLTFLTQFLLTLWLLANLLKYYF